MGISGGTLHALEEFRPRLRGIALVGPARAGLRHRGRGGDTSDAATYQLTIPTVIVGAATYSNLVVTIGSMVSIRKKHRPMAPVSSRARCHSRELVEGTDGNPYGTSSAGGLYNSGTVFQLTHALAPP